MPRVPTYTPQLKPTGRAGYRPAAIRPDYSVAEGVQALKGAGTALAVDIEKEQYRVDAEREKAKAEANSLLEAEALLEQQRRFARRWRGDSTSAGRIDDAFTGEDTEQGLLSVKGKDALGKSVEVLEALDKDQQELAERFNDPEARRRFLIRAGQQALAYRRDVETHADQQVEVAKLATVAAREEALYDSAATATPETYLEQLDAVAEDKRKLAPSPESGEAAVGDLRKKASLFLVDGLIAQGRVAEADAFLERNKASLGVAYIQGKRAVGPQVAAAKKEQELADTRALVRSHVTTAREKAQEKAQTKGYASEEDIRSAVPMEGHTEAGQQALEHFVREEVAEEKRRKAADIDTERDNVLRADGQRSSLPQYSVDFLWEHDPGFMRGLEAQRLARWKKSQDAGEGTDKAQQQVDLIFRNRYASLPREEQQRLSPEAYAVQFADEMAKDGLAVEVSKLGLSFAGKEREESRRQLDKGIGADEDRFVASFEAQLRRRLQKEAKKKPIDEAQVQEMAGNARSEWRAWHRKNNGMEGKAEDELAARLFRDVVLEPGKTYELGPFSMTLGEKRGLEAQRPRPAEPPVTVQQTPSPSAAPRSSATRPPPPSAAPGPGDSWIWVKDGQGRRGWMAASKFDSSKYTQVSE